VICATLSLKFLCLVKEGTKPSLWNHYGGGNVICRLNVSHLTPKKQQCNLPCKASSN